MNALQTNSATLQQSMNRTHNAQCTNVTETAEFLEKIGVKLNDLDKLSVIHIAGTKGKVEFHNLHVLPTLKFEMLLGINLCTRRINFAKFKCQNRIF